RRGDGETGRFEVPLSPRLPVPPSPLSLPREMRLLKFSQERQSVSNRDAEAGRRLRTHQDGLVDADHLAVGAEYGAARPSLVRARVVNQLRRNVADVALSRLRTNLRAGGQFVELSPI